MCCRFYVSGTHTFKFVFSDCRGCSLKDLLKVSAFLHPEIIYFIMYLLLLSKEDKFKAPKEEKA